MDSLIKIKGNICSICYTQELYWSSNPKKSQVEVFICRHFICKDCYKKLNKKKFKCPICRCKGNFYKETFSSIEIKKWNTLSDWYYHWEDFIKINPSGLKRSQFGKIYFGLIGDIKDYIYIKKEEKMKKLIEKKKKLVRLNKKAEKDISICKLCQTKCTSLIQLKRHTNSRNCLKKQKKLLSIHSY